MTVYLVEFSVDYEGSDVKGVFSTWELARKFIDKEIPKTDPRAKLEDWHYDLEGCWRWHDLSYTILSHEVDSQ